MLRKAKREAILNILEETYKDTKTALNYNSPFELLIAVILSAQCTDERVNKITARIFPRLNTPEKMGALTQEQMEQEIRDCGLYRAKAKNLLATCKMLVEEFNSTVPDNIETLMKLPGVGKKTANVIASIIYNVPAIAVDTHVFRVSHRIGLVPARCTTPYSVEKELTRHIPDELIPIAHHWLILHGRYTCIARKPKCEECGLNTLCRYYKRQVI